MTFSKRYLISVYCIILILNSCNKPTSEILPTLDAVTESVYASVTIQPEDMYNVFSTAPGIIDHLLIEVGDAVKAGQIIVVLESTIPIIATESARINTDLARVNYKGKSGLLNTLKNEIETVSAQMKLDSFNYVRQQRLWGQNIGSLSDLENRKIKYDASSNSLVALKNRLNQTKNELKVAYQQSNQALKNAQSRQDDYSIRSRLDGRVYDVLKEEGELVTQQTLIARIGQSDSFVIEMLIDEVDIARIQVGQTALVSLDAYPGEAFRSTIHKIIPLKDERNQTFMVEGKFVNPPEVLFAGLSGEGNVLISNKENVLTIPQEYLLDGEKVLTEDGEKVVSIGIRTIDRVEILSGIDASTIILKP
ncbi:MAG: HlyD family secretion protein [Parvicellaceae bacterium]|jgi:HlyD family secretion protein